MKRILQLGVLVFALLFAFHIDAQAQSRKKSSSTDKYFDESGNFTSQLWYGAGFVFPSFGSGTNVFTGARYSFFNFGISPMVGYKVTPELSAGLRLSLFYSFYNLEGLPAANALDYGAGAFARYKIFNAIFVHGEFGFDNEVFDYRLENNDLVPERVLRQNGFLGLGYNDGNGVWGYEILLLYNLLYDDSDFNTPFDLRFGFTYNF
jgi:hypothetical protein